MRRALFILVLAAFAAGCGSTPAGGPPPIALGTKCDNCGMRVQDLKFASEREVGKGWRKYESIECLIADLQKTPGGTVYLPDHDTQTLHPADSVWVVKGSFPTPMGGGYAAFLDRAAADTIAAHSEGRVDRFTAFAAGGTPAP